MRLRDEERRLLDAIETSMTHSPEQWQPKWCSIWNTSARIGISENGCSIYVGDWLKSYTTIRLSARGTKALKAIVYSMLTDRVLGAMK